MMHLSFIAYSLFCFPTFLWSLPDRCCVQDSSNILNYATTGHNIKLVLLRMWIEQQLKVVTETATQKGNLFMFYHLWQIICVVVVLPLVCISHAIYVSSMSQVLKRLLQYRTVHSCLLLLRSPPIICPGDTFFVKKKKKRGRQEHTTQRNESCPQTGMLSSCTLFYLYNEGGNVTKMEFFSHNCTAQASKLVQMQIISSPIFKGFHFFPLFTCISSEVTISHLIIPG